MRADTFYSVFFQSLRLKLDVSSEGGGDWVLIQNTSVVKRIDTRIDHKDTLLGVDRLSHTGTRPSD